MKVTRVDGGTERLTVLGCVVSDAVLGRVASRWGTEPDGLFDSRWANQIVGMCVDYLTRYGKCPGRAIESLHRSWAETCQDDELVSLTSRFLSGVSDDYDTMGREINPDYVLDKAGEHFNRVKLARLKDRLEAHLEAGDLKKAQGLWDSHLPIEMGTGGWIDPFTDDEFLRGVLEEHREPIVRYREGLGEFFGGSLERDRLIAVMASAKRGKSYVLADVGFEVLEQGRKVAFFECGDLSQLQVGNRLMRRACRRPLDARKYQIPLRITMSGREPVVQWDELETKTQLDLIKAKKKRDQYIDKCDGRSRFRLSVHPNSSISVTGIRSILSRWSREGFDPDVVIIDYADILAPINGKVETREQIGATWKTMRRMSQELHCLVVTATQANADSYDAELLTRSNFSENRMKYDHVDGMFGLNQNHKEKEKGMYRLNWLVRREEEYNEKEVCHAAGCLSVAAPFIKSVFRGDE